MASRATQASEVTIKRAKRNNRFYSLKALISQTADLSSDQREQQTMRQLQRLFQIENLQEQPVAQPVAVIPGFEQLKIEQKLWKFLRDKVNQFPEKVEWERINMIEKLFWQIKKQVRQKTTSNNNGIESLQSIIKQRYKQIHSMFEQMRQDSNMGHLVEKKTKHKKQKIQVIETSQKIKGLKESIDSIRSQVEGLQARLGQISLQQRKIQKQWKTVLKNMLKNQYYLKDGLTTIFKEIIQAQLTINESNLPDVLDLISKQFLMKQYESLKTSDRSNQGIQTHRRIVSQSTGKDSLTQLLKNDLMRDVYRGTRQYMNTLIKETRWKKQSLILPKIGKRSVNQNEWRQQQFKRIQHAYQNKKIRHKVRSIMFGPKVQNQ